MNALEFITQNKGQMESIFDSCSNYLFDAVSPEDLADAIESGIDIKDFVIEAYQESGLDQVEIIYYYNAIEYLKANDPTLTESLELASDMGFGLKNLNSEVLASLHATDAESGKIADAAEALRTLINQYLFHEAYENTLEEVLSCADPHIIPEEEMNGICPECGLATSGGQCMAYCNYSPESCSECGARRCDKSC